jgi:hypothetical protein
MGVSNLLKSIRATDEDLNAYCRPRHLFIDAKNEKCRILNELTN